MEAKITPKEQNAKVSAVTIGTTGIVLIGLGGLAIIGITLYFVWRLLDKHGGEVIKQGSQLAPFLL